MPTAVGKLSTVSNHVNNHQCRVTKPLIQSKESMKKLIPAMAFTADHKRLLVAMVCTIAAASVFAIEISEEMLNGYVKQALTKKSNRDFRILNPKISLLDGYATLCARVNTRVFAREVDFCADMTPKWRQETGSLLASKMSLTSLQAPGISAKDIELVKAIVNQVVLPRMEGIEVYKADNFIGKQISDLKVMPGKLDLSL